MVKRKAVKKRKYINGSPNISLSSYKVMVVNKKGINILTKGSKRSMLDFWVSEKIGETQNDVFPLVITSMIDHFDVS